MQVWSMRLGHLFVVKDLCSMCFRSSRSKAEQCVWFILVLPGQSLLSCQPVKQKGLNCPSWDWEQQRISIRARYLQMLKYFQIKILVFTKNPGPQFCLDHCSIYFSPSISILVHGSPSFQLHILIIRSVQRWLQKCERRFGYSCLSRLLFFHRIQFFTAQQWKDHGLSSFLGN